MYHRTMPNLETREVGLGCLDGATDRFSMPVEAPMTTTELIAIGILTWIPVSIVLARFLARATRLHGTQVWPEELLPIAPVGKPVLDATVDKPVFAPTVETMARFPARPTRFVGRAEVMAAAHTALAPNSGCTTVLFHGMAGAGKTTCAVELAYRHRRTFAALAFWSAPTDPDHFGDALRLLAMELESQLGDEKCAFVDKIAHGDLESFLSALTAVFDNAGVLLVLDNLETLLTPDGQWRDLRWAPLIDALAGYTGPSRIILTSRVMPAGLTADTVLIRPVPTLSRDESLLLVGELPTLCRLLRCAALARCVLTLTQGHPQLLEFVDAAAADPPRLAYQLADIEAAVDSAALLGAFVVQGHTRLDAKQLLQTFNAWTITVAETVPARARLLLQVLCRMDETDRSMAVVSDNWPALWRRLDQSGEPPLLASSVAALVNAGLITTDPIGGPADQTEAVRYRIHPGIAEAIQAVTPETVTAAVDAQLTAWWAAVVDGWIQAPEAGDDTSQVRVQASLAAARYLLRQHDWDAASCMLERALTQVGYSLASSLAVIPPLRRIAEGTGALKDLVVLGAAVRRLDPDEAEILLRRAYDQTTSSDQYGLASTTAGELVTLLRDQGRLNEALTLANRKIEHTREAGFGLWTQLGDQGRRLQILNLLGHHEQVLGNVTALRAQLAQLPDQRSHNDRVNPGNVREGVLDIGRLSAVALGRWDVALDLNDELTRTKRRRGASPHEAACSRFNDYVVLLHLGRLADADHLLLDCQDVFDSAGDSTQLAVVYGARANLAEKRGQLVDAVDLQRTSLRLCYVQADPRKIAAAHHGLAGYLSRAAGNLAEQRAHRLAASLLNYFIGDTGALTGTLGALSGELHGDISSRTAAALPTTLPQITRLVDADDGVRFDNIVSALCADPAAAEHALAELLTSLRR
jgi:hypothetical protein